MQFESLKVFCDVARFRSFSQAASVNGLTQSAASQIVLQLEKRLEIQLVDRSTRPLQLTRSGQTYYEGCKGLYEQYMELESSIRSTHAQLAATIQVAAIYSVGLGDMGQYVERFVVQQPNVRVQIEYLHPDRVYERVLDGTADFGLVSFPRKSRELVALPWREETMVLACAPCHPLANQKTLAPAQLVGVKYIGFERGLVIRREVDRFLRENEVAVELALEFDNIENIKKAVEIGAGVALVPEPTIRKEVETGTLTALPLSGWKMSRPLGIIHRRSPRLSATAQRFIDLLRRPEGNGVAGLPETRGHTNGAGPGHDDSHLGRNGAARGSRRLR